MHAPSKLEAFSSQMTLTCQTTLLRCLDKYLPYFLKFDQRLTTILLDSNIIKCSRSIKMLENLNQTQICQNCKCRHLDLKLTFDYPRSRILILFSSSQISVPFNWRPDMSNSLLPPYRSYFQASLLEAVASFIWTSSSFPNSSFVGFGFKLNSSRGKVCCRGLTHWVLQWWGLRSVKGSEQGVSSSSFTWVSIWINVKAFSKNMMSIPAGMWKLLNLFSLMFDSFSKVYAECLKPNFRGAYLPLVNIGKLWN